MALEEGGGEERERGEVKKQRWLLTANTQWRKLSLTSLVMRTSLLTLVLILSALASSRTQEAVRATAGDSPLPLEPYWLLHHQQYHPDPPHERMLPIFASSST